MVTIEEKFGKAENFMAIEGAFYLRNFSFAPEAAGEYQAFIFGRTNKYGFKIRLDYLRQFSRNAFSYEFGGYYYFLPIVQT